MGNVQKVFEGFNFDSKTGIVTWKDQLVLTKNVLFVVTAHYNDFSSATTSFTLSFKSGDLFDYPTKAYNKTLAYDFNQVKEKNLVISPETSIIAGANKRIYSVSEYEKASLSYFGMSIDPNTGVISGTPTRMGRVKFTVQEVVAYCNDPAVCKPAESCDVYNDGCQVFY